MLPLRSQRRFVLLHNGEAEPRPRPRGARPPPRAPLAALRALEGTPGGESGNLGAAEAEREGRKRASPRGS